MSKQIKNLAFRNPGPALDHFNPETSQRQERKNQWVTKQSQKSKKSLYDEQGCLIADGRDLCDCLIEGCQGCFYRCDRCGSPKCGLECRVNRKWHHDTIAVEGANGETRQSPLKRRSSATT